MASVLYLLLPFRLGESPERWGISCKKGVGQGSNDVWEGSEEDCVDLFFEQERERGMWTGGNPKPRFSVGESNHVLAIVIFFEKRVSIIFF